MFGKLLPNHIYKDIYEITPEALREAGIAVALGGVLNIFLDPLFMFVLLPRGNEVRGVGIATLLSNIISYSWLPII